MGEIWKDIKCYEGLYQVSNLGNVRSLDRYVTNSLGRVYFYKGEKKSVTDRGNGYYCVGLCKDGKNKIELIHRLVAQAFIPNPNNLPFINHKDENPSHNNVENLEWCTAKYNQNYGTCIKRRSEKKSIKIYQYSLDGKLIKIWKNSVDITKETGYDFSNIRKCCRGERKTANGFVWKDFDNKKEIA